VSFVDYAQLIGGGLLALLVAAVWVRWLDQRLAVLPQWSTGVRRVVGVLVVAGPVLFVGSWLYHTAMESSRHQATLGKKALGIIVTDMNGNRISFARANARFFGKWVSGMIMNIGYLMAAFTEKKQALHDILASCLVVMK